MQHRTLIEFFNLYIVSFLKAPNGAIKLSDFLQDLCQKAFICIVNNKILTIFKGESMCESDFFLSKMREFYFRFLHCFTSIQKVFIRS